MLSSVYRARAAPAAIANETPAAPGNFLGWKLQRQPFLSAKSTKRDNDEMFYDDLRKTLALLELEDKGVESDEDIHHPIAGINSIASSSSPPSLASSHCSLSVGAREEDEDFTLLLCERTCKVAFSTVKVRQYTITVGDHPCCTTGYPLSLDWDYETMPELALEVFEASHGQKRNRQELLTSYEERKSRLEDCCTEDAQRLNRRLERQKCRNRRGTTDTFFS